MPRTDRIYTNKAQTHGICTNKAHTQTEPTQTGPRHQVNSNRKDHNRRNLQIQGLGTQGICTNRGQTQKEPKTYKFRTEGSTQRGPKNRNLQREGEGPDTEEIYTSKAHNRQKLHKQSPDTWNQHKQGPDTEGTQTFTSKAQNI